MEKNEPQASFLRDRGHSAISKEAEELFAKLSRGEIDTFVFSDAAIALFIKREMEFAKITGGNPKTISDAYEAVRYSPETISLRNSLQYSTRHAVIENGKHMAYAIEKYFGAKNSDYEALAYPPFINYVVHSHIGGIARLPTDTNLHVVNLYKGLRAVLTGGEKSFEERTQTFEGDDDFSISAVEHTVRKKRKRETPLDPHALRREAVFSLLLLMYFAQMQTKLRVQTLISDSPISYAQAGNEIRFWKSRLYGSSESEGIEFCRGYFEKASRALAEDMKDIFGDNADSARKLWDAVCFVQGSLIQLADLASLRNPIFSSLVQGDFTGAVRELLRAAQENEHFREAAARFGGGEFLNDAARAMAPEQKRARPESVEMREVRNRERVIQKLRADAERRIQNYERLKHVVGRFFCDKTLAAEDFPLLVYRISAPLKTIKDYVTVKGGRQERVFRDVPHIIIIPYFYHKNTYGEPVYKGKGGKRLNEHEFEKKLNAGELEDITDRDGFLALFPNIKNP